MQFCNKCGTLMMPKGKRFYCRKCKTFKLATSPKELLVKEKVNHEPTDEVYVADTKSQVLPTVTEECPKCQNKQAYYWFEQTRSLDEPATRFFRCTKCKQTWREYS